MRLECIEVQQAGRVLATDSRGWTPTEPLQLGDDIPKHVEHQFSVGLAQFEDFQTPLAGTNNNEGLSFRKSKTNRDNKEAA